MSVPVIDVAIALKAAIEGALSITVERRYSAYFDPGQVRDGKYLLVTSGEDTDAKRGIDLLDLTVDVGYQIALPVPTESEPDPANNLTWADGQMAKVQAIKQLFRAGGSLRDSDFAGATYLRMTNSPIFRPEMLRDNQIFTSVLRLEFRLEA